jgi:hypothetical protein
VNQRDQREHQDAPGEAAREPDTLRFGAAHLDGETQAEQERKDGEELAEDQHAVELRDELVERREGHESGPGWPASQEAAAGVRDDDAEQRECSKHVDYGDPAATGDCRTGFGSHGWASRDVEAAQHIGKRGRTRGR